VHRNTVRAWIKSGLTVCGTLRPYLIRGGDLRSYLHGRRKQNKHPCKQWEFYCLTCRAPKTPAGKMADCRASKGGLGMLEGYCTDCDRMMYRCVNLAKLDQFRNHLDITLTMADSRITQRTHPILNGDFKQSGDQHG
jgi:hypothetical protein